MRCAETLLLTSSFPRYPGDWAGCFVEEMASQLLELGPVRVLAPYDERLKPGYAPEGLIIDRFAERFTDRPGPFYGKGGPENLEETKRLAEAPYALAAMQAAACKLAISSARIVSHWMIPSGLVGASLRREDRPHQLVVHGGGWQTLKRSPFGRMLARWIIRRSDDVVAVSKRFRDELIDLFEGAERDSMFGKIRSLPMGIEYNRYRQEATGPRSKAVLTVGRLEPIKGFAGLAKELRGLDTPLWLAGDGSERSKILAACNKYRVSVRHYGWLDRDKLIALYKSCGILALPSLAVEGRQEGSPRVLIEGMAAGCPIVAADCGGIGEIIEHGVNGLLDKDGSLRVQLQRLSSDRKLARRLGRKAGEDAVRFDWERNRTAWLKPFS